MKKGVLLNSEISAVVADMGHFDTLAIGDAGMPVPAGTKKIDLAVTKDLPRFDDVVKTILQELEVQRAYVALEMKTNNPEGLKSLIDILGSQVEIVFIPHEQMKKDLKYARAFVRTGEEHPFSNVILESGVVF
ncbi:D-ribose pyranase [Oenococcus kitaharae]|uniref:D-ribose pyranase n=1 Tax=Oenococcus kitaharae DSM 17330 TaxID=1045004 RepID=G9WJ23_9LACO|nr:D-ribose pyranase [Oenococcus kitaharae]EHN58472.1 Ribose ABC transport system high affinity permease [Oenococcus kitaharae DSM 17330]MCV3296289.1 D-ribose pyranase [Oenococcus kitaharae]OEY81374.1 ribose pyranase [Oenococcus kitaharae]OEY82862.1 ribose pyranase [Oenococcus kitaharae]OEY84594.1 ribose pyranase [Oenococcus kitaharae]